MLKDLTVFHKKKKTNCATVCGRIFVTIKNKQVCCSKKCGAIFRAQNPEYRENLSKNAKQRVNNGTHKGWQSREKIKPSFPEKVVMEILSELNFSYLRELKVGKWFIDFAFKDKMIALEIDGKQHTYPERMIKDQEKDSFLNAQGWKVHRIKWQILTPEFRSSLKEEISNVINCTT